MTRTSYKSVSVALAVLLALTVGLVGTATVGNAAAAITKAQVKKIAKKVVQKQAPTLAVASAATAATATNATNLQGQPPSQFKNPVYRFVLPVQTTAVSRSYSFPGLPAGSYLVGYSVFATVSAANAQIVCQVRANASSSWEGFSGSTSYGTNNPTTQATAVLQLTSAPPELFCTSPSTTFSIYSASTYLSTVTFTRVDGIVTGTPTVARPGREKQPTARQH